MTKRRSKISKLPKDIQDQVNTMLDEGATYQSIVDWLTTKGHPDFNLDNLHQWKEGGFQDWLHEQRRIERSKALMGWGAHLVAENPGFTAHSALVLFGSVQLQGLLEEIDFLQAQGSILEHPDNYARCFNALHRFAKLSFEMEKHGQRLKLEQDKLKLLNPPPEPAKGVITEEELARKAREL